MYEVCMSYNVRILLDRYEQKWRSPATLVWTQNTKSHRNPFCGFRHQICGWTERSFHYAFYALGPS